MKLREKGLRHLSGLSANRVTRLVEYSLRFKLDIFLLPPKKVDQDFLHLCSMHHWRLYLDKVKYVLLAIDAPIIAPVTVVASTV